MKTPPYIHALYIGIIIALLLVKCDRWFKDALPDNEVVFETPEMKGTLKSEKPLKHYPIIYRGNQKGTAGKLVNSKTENTENDSINKLITELTADRLEAYKKLDSLEREKMFADAIAPMDVTETLENDTIKIDMLAKVSGLMHDVNLNYTLKPLKHKVNLKQYLLLGGVEVGSNQLLNEFRVKGNIQYLSPSKTLFSGGFDNQKIIYLGVSKKIFSFSRQQKK